MNTRITLILAVFAAVAATRSAEGALILQLDFGNTSTYTGTNAPYDANIDGDGVRTTGTSTWNAISGATSSLRYANDGAASGVALTFGSAFSNSSAVTWGTTVSTFNYSILYSHPAALVGDVAYKDGAVVMGAKISGLPAGTYAIYAMGISMYEDYYARQTGQINCGTNLQSAYNNWTTWTGTTCAVTPWIESQRTMANPTGVVGDYARFTVTLGSGDFLGILSSRNITTSTASFLNFAQIVGLPTIACSDPVSASIFAGNTGTLGLTVGNSGVGDLSYSLTAAVQSGAATLGGTPDTGAIPSGAAAQAQTITAQSSSLGVNTIRFTTTDANATNNGLTQDVTLTVYEHSMAEFVGDDTTLTLEFGNAIPLHGLAQQSFSIENLAATLAGYRVALGLDSTAEEPGHTGTGKFSLGSLSLASLAAGSPSNLCDVTLDTSVAGEFTAVYTFGLSDDSDIAGAQLADAQTLTLTLHGTVVPEPATVAFLAFGGLSLLGGAIRRRRSA